MFQKDFFFILIFINFIFIFFFYIYSKKRGGGPAFSAISRFFDLKKRKKKAFQEKNVNTSLKLDLFLFLCQPLYDFFLFSCQKWNDGEKCTSKGGEVRVLPPCPITWALQIWLFYGFSESCVSFFPSLLLVLNLPYLLVKVQRYFLMSLVLIFSAIGGRGRGGENRYKEGVVMSFSYS